MSWASRSTRIALTAYALVAALILGGVTWATVSTIGYERLNAEILRANDFRERLNRSLGRMDNRLVPIIAREAAREYWQYAAYSHPRIYRPDGSDALAESVLQASPLIEQKLEPWIKLHFQVDSNNEWRSPQVPSNYRLSVGATIPVVDRVLGAQRSATLDRLSRTVTHDVLAEQIERDAQGGIGAHFDFDPPSRCTSAICEKSFEQEYRLRMENQRRMQSMTLPQPMCEDSSVAISNLLNQPMHDTADGSVIPITVSAMTAVWLGPDDDGQYQLAFVRSVDTDLEGVDSIQGFLVDWDALKLELLDSAAGDLEKPDLIPVTGPEAVNPDRQLAALPATIIATPPDPGPMPWTSTYLLLLVALCAAGAVLGGAGLGVRNLLALTERRTQFAYAVTHELRTPLTTLRLYTDMLAHGLVRAEDRESYVRTLHAECERLAGLVDEVLEYARVENRRVQLDVRPITVSELLESIRAQCENRCSNTGKQLVVEVNGLAGETIRTDPQLVRQVVSNLIDNACKYTRDASDPTITLRAIRQHGGRISLDVEDHGPGIAPTQQAAIFKPFRRGHHGEQQAPGGIGLGLALAKSWAHLLRGRLDLVDTPSPSGACFRLTIPKTA